MSNLQNQPSSQSYLQVKTRGNSSAQGKERVYFTCHPQDFELFFEDICKDIFASQNCAIYHRQNYAEPWQQGQMESDLSAMQLLVVPVTTRFLQQQNVARCEELVFAREHNIPVLPLMQESGIAYAFNQICGEFQFLDKHAQDVTALPYADKLALFLKNVLLGDSLSERVRKAFDAYIFLSYRKKDRAQAQQLMKLIHASPACRDIAIWYDEFLVPGENFNSGIDEALTKSNLVVMNITPNMVNEPNYVISTEYPAAVRAGKPIVAVQMVPTEQSLLDKEYCNIPRSVDGYNSQQLDAALLQGLGKLNDTANDNDPQHLYLIGLAYLNGIDVEVDTARGVQLITQAAEADNEEAMEFLSDMYIKGKAVPYNPDLSARWQQKIVQAKTQNYTLEPTLANAIALLDSYNSLGVRYANTGSTDKSHQCMLEALPIAEQIAQQFDDEQVMEQLASIYHALATVSNVKQQLSQGFAYAEKALELYLALERNNPSNKHKAQLAETLAAKGAAVESSNIDLAIELFSQALLLRQQLVDDSPTADNKMWLGFANNALGKALAQKGDNAAAKQYCADALAIADDLVEEQRKVSSVALFVQSANNLGMCYKQLKQYNLALKYLQLSIKRATWLSESCQLELYKNSIYATQINIGTMFAEQGDYVAAVEWLNKGIEGRLGQLGNKSDAKNLLDCANAYLALADICGQSGNGAGKIDATQNAAQMVAKAADIAIVPYGAMCVGTNMQLFDLLINSEQWEQALQALAAARNMQQKVTAATGETMEKLNLAYINGDYLMFVGNRLEESLPILRQTANLLVEVATFAAEHNGQGVEMGFFAQCIESLTDVVADIDEQVAQSGNADSKLHFADSLITLFRASRNGALLQKSYAYVEETLTKQPNDEQAWNLLEKIKKELG